MNADAWRYAFASVVGTSHEKRGLPCQDASDCRVLQAADGSFALVAVASDGAGSASRSAVGAQLACSLIMAQVESALGSRNHLSDITREAATQWLEQFQTEVRLRAEEEDRPMRDFACTLLAAVIGTDRAAFIQIGDGAIVVSHRLEPDEYAWVFWPQQGEYANVTNFATDPAACSYLEFATVNGVVDDVAIFTDGIQSLALHYQTQTAYAPFFQPIFKEIEAAPRGFSEPLSSLLTNFLTSPRIISRTDDDKTLIVATRRERSDQLAVTTDS